MPDWNNHLHTTPLDPNFEVLKELNPQEIWNLNERRRVRHSKAQNRIQNFDSDIDDSDNIGEVYTQNSIGLMTSDA